MKVFVQTGGEVNAKTAIKSADLIAFMRNVAGKKAEIEVDPDVTIDSFVDRVRSQLITASYTRAVVMKKDVVVSGASLGSAGIVDGDSVIVKFILEH